VTTFRQLKAVLDTLTDVQLDAPARWSGEDIGGDSVHLSVLREEHIMTEDGMQPVGVLGDDTSSIRAEFPESQPWPAGTPLLSVD
jgi:hypothetical protein